MHHASPPGAWDGAPELWYRDRQNRSNPSGPHRPAQPVVSSAVPAQQAVSPAVPHRSPKRPVSPTKGPHHTSPATDKGELFEHNHPRNFLIE